MESVTWYICMQYFISEIFSELSMGVHTCNPSTLQGRGSRRIMILRLAWAAWSMKPCFKTQKRFKNLFCIGGVLIIHFLKKFLLAFFFLFIYSYVHTLFGPFLPLIILWEIPSAALLWPFRVCRLMPGFFFRGVLADHVDCGHVSVEGLYLTGFFIFLS
jgi:hypothetical protein